MITQHGWLFLTSFSKLRGIALSSDITNLLHLGARAFDEISGEVVQSVSIVFRKSNIPSYRGKYCRLVDGNSEREKESMFLQGKERYCLPKNKFLEIDECPIAYWISDAMFECFKSQQLGKVRNAASTTLAWECRGW